MVQRPGAKSRSSSGRFDPICRVAYELGLLIGVVTLILTALHASFTSHATINATLDASHVRATVDDPGAFPVGATNPVYRFHQNWLQPIGEARTDRVEGKEVTFEFDPNTFRWPMGRQGKVLSVDGERCTVDLGSSNKLAQGDKLDVFTGRRMVAELQLVQVAATESVGQLTAKDSQISPVDLVGKTVSEFSVATQVVSFDSAAIRAIDVILFVGAIVAYILGWRRFGGSPFGALLPRLKAVIRPGTVARTAFQVAIGIPAIWLLTDFSIRTVAYFIYLGYSNFIRQPVPTPLTGDRLQDGLIPLFSLLAIAYIAGFVVMRASPLEALVKRVAFRGGVFGHAAKDFPEHFSMWCLQLIIVYTFARTIGGFFQGNLNLAITSSWPSAPPVVVPQIEPVSQAGIARAGQSIAYAMTHSPHPATEDALFATFDSIVYNVCIFACLIGYGYSLLGYLWGKRIRNVDFTVVGWVTNAVCYGPLLGYVFWQMFPPVFGLDPTVTPGLLRTATFAVAVSLNVIYTLSIWNLGVMFGVMTDKGVRTTGFYSVVRHPSYTLESLMFVLFYCRELSSWSQWLAVAGFFFIYWLRSEREDQFMSASNPEYLEYKERVRYKFIPGLY